MKTFEKFGTAIPQILLPKNIDLKTWSVIACDQYTQDREYWENARALKEHPAETVSFTHNAQSVLFPSDK